jgi:hypothetical protein
MNRWLRYAPEIALVLGAAFSRLIPHPPNFTAVGALALFSGATLGRGRWGLVVPLLALLLSDAVLGFHSLMPVVYLAFGLIVLLGRKLSQGLGPYAARLWAASFAASLIFFFISNVGVWFFYYPRSLEGLSACFVAALPFFKNTLLGDLLFSSVLFGLQGCCRALISHPTQASRASD